jgi:hypothetical protein
MRSLGHYWRFVPESPHIRVYIRAYPPEYRPVRRTTRFRFYLQIAGLGIWTVLTEPLDRTQEVGGLNPPIPGSHSNRPVNSPRLGRRTGPAVP